MTESIRVLENLPASRILAIPIDRPSELFGDADRNDLSAAFRALIKRWHPDNNGGSSEANMVLAQIISLHEAAKRRLGAREAVPSDTVKVRDGNGRSFALAFKVRRPFELGETTVSHTKLGFFIDREYAGLFDAGIQMLAGVRYPDAEIRSNMERLFPSPRGVYETDGAKVSVFDKSADVVVLSDLIAHMGGALPPKHAAWVVSSLLNFCCLLEFSGLTTNALSPESVLVTPTHHAAFTLSWWYAARAGSRISLLPPCAFDIIPRAMVRDKKASIRLDLEAVRAIGRACLGDPSGASLPARADIPPSVSAFLRLPASASAVEDYRSWTVDALPGFGPRRFLKLEITSRDVYP